MCNVFSSYACIYIQNARDCDWKRSCYKTRELSINMHTVLQWRISYKKYISSICSCIYPKLLPYITCVVYSFHTYTYINIYNWYIYIFILLHSLDTGRGCMRHVRSRLQIKVLTATAHLADAFGVRIQKRAEATAPLIGTGHNQLRGHRRRMLGHSACCTVPAAAGATTWPIVYGGCL